MKRVGTIYDVIGRVDSPYGLVRPVSIDQSLLGQSIYVKESDVAKRGRRK
ncbi:H/ACA RNA-protein complex protein Gar1 [Thermoproteus tenax]|nr:H/ACA RNA-protein complex protein Gar1 [Thermoproteus tenax]